MAGEWKSPIVAPNQRWAPLFRPPKLDGSVLNHLLRALTGLNEDYLRQHPRTPRLYASGVRYRREPGGKEEWLTIPFVLERGYGDCLPVSTLVRRIDESGPVDVPIVWLRPGDRIVSDIGADMMASVTTVTRVAYTGNKPILALGLDKSQGLDFRTLLVSPEHRIISPDQNELRAENVRVGDGLRSPWSAYATARVMDISERRVQPCADITTEAGRFWLPESDVVVHNCEDLACWRVAELRVFERENARATWYVSRKTAKGSLYHIVVRRGNGGKEDPSILLGMPVRAPVEVLGL